ncbi:centrosomal protein of 97 kDa [Dunckerocampus dactyliophorus]|uniref:centrosomal protein of 97 kDa n=1 Tax=Dunckerocampus dactyliophorus TaxID=161453 RepID=UPI0024076A6E|nr:centrosomal protein of 97 kDa [Dunckerocampus dactyliophorus]
MGVSDLEFDTNGPVVDLSARGMRKLDSSFVCSEDTHTLILDQNQIMKLDHLERNPSLQQLSVASNRLVRMMGVSQLKELQILNLPNNSIGYIEGLRDLPNLKWLNLSGNAIKVIEQLNNCVSLQHLDLSDNSISNIGDLSKLVALKTLLLHGNSITTLRTVPANLSAHVSILSLASNEITDLNEVAYLASLHELAQLSIMNNPCVMPTPSLPRFDYRPYVMSWCLNLKVLDGFGVSQKEGLKAEWLYSQGKGRSYRPGQHVQLVQYLSTVCLRTSSSPLVMAEDAKLEKILTKQRFHQMQLLEETRGECPNPPWPTQLAVEKTGPLHTSPQGGAIEGQKLSTPSPAAVLVDQEKGPAVQFNTWVSCNSSSASLPHVCSPIKLREESLCLEDVQTDEDKLNSSMLSSESSFLPFAPDLEPQLSHTDSEDETETFEADSLAPMLPRAAPPEQKNKGMLECAAISSQAPHLEAPKEEERLKFMTKQSTCEEVKRAAVKIQSWWRGQYTRCCHPVAREVRSEIRLRRMQDHIIFLTEKLDRVQKQCEEERLQRLVQEDAVRFLWKQVQSMLQWKQSVDKQLLSLTHISGGPCQAAPPLVACSTANQAATDMSFPDSGFQTTREEQALREDSFLSSGTGESVMTVRAPSPSGGGGADSTDCSLLEQYASSLQQREEEDEAEEVVSDHSVTPRRSSPVSPGKSALQTRDEVQEDCSHRN